MFTEGDDKMELAAIGSVNNYSGSMKTQLTWEIKNDSTDSSHEFSPIEKYIEQQRSKLQGFPGAYSDNDTDAGKMEAIQTKLAVGKKLTPDEMEYMKNNDPMTYQQIKSAEAEQQSYEKEIKRCRTKEEVSRVHAAHANASLTNVSAVRNNPDIPPEKKFKMLMIERRKMDGIARVTNTFVQSTHYTDLPTDEEKRSAEQIMRRAEDDENGSKDISLISYDKEGTERFSLIYDSFDNDDVTVTEAENLPQSQKLRRARARAAYVEKTFEFNPITFGTINVKA